METDISMPEVCVECGEWREKCCCSKAETFASPGALNPAISCTDWLAAMALLKESRESIAACFRVISQTTSDPTIIVRLEFELKQAGVKDGIGVRLQDFIAAKGALPPEPRKSANDTEMSPRQKNS